MASTDLLFTQPANPAGSPVEIVFGDDGSGPPDVTVELQASTDLLFTQPANPAGSPVEIVFGDDGSGPPDVTVELQASGRITGLRGHVAARVAVRVGASGRITGLRGFVAVPYDINVVRPTVGTTPAAYQAAQRLRSATHTSYQQARPRQVPVLAAWQNARATSVPTNTRWQDAARMYAATAHTDQQARRLGAVPTVQTWQEAQRTRAATLLRNQQGLRLSATALQGFENARRLRHATEQWFDRAAQLGAPPVRSRLGNGVPVRVALASRYQEAWRPRPGTSAQPQPIVTPCYVPGLPADLVFDIANDSAQPLHLVFICEGHTPGPGPDPEPGATVVVPIRSVYVTVNTLTLTRASDGALIPCAALGMSLDVDSWTWQWQATLHAEALPLITPGPGGDPVNVLAAINGTPYRLAVEGYTRSRTFGSTRIAVRGRGRAAILDAPYAPTLNFGNTAARTAQQLMGDVLTVNGVPIGWSIDWGLTDWSVPANVWAVQGAYIAGILDIAGAAGGYVQPHDTAQTLRILPRYPAAPWDWASLTPDYDLPAAVVGVEGTEWLQKPDYNRVHVSGTTAGVLGEVTRTGTAGDAVAPMATHPLITTAAAARQRGIAELSDTGRQARLSLRLPVLEETGVIKPGAFVRYVDNGTPHLGLVRGTQVEWSRPTLRQVIDIETHPA